MMLEEFKTFCKKQNIELEVINSRCVKINGQMLRSSTITEEEFISDCMYYINKINNGKNTQETNHYNS